VSVADVHKSIVVTYDVSFLITSVSGNSITCKSAYSVGMEVDDMIQAGAWYLADFSTTSVGFCSFV